MNIEYSEASFIKCAERGDSLAVKLFLASGMGPNIKDIDGMTPLMMAAQNSRDNIVSVLLQKGADLNSRENKNGFNAILLAACHGHLNTVKLLLLKGAKINDRSKHGNTPLMGAAMYGKNVKLVKYLIENRAEVNDKNDDGKTPLFYAVFLGSRNIDIVNLLLGSGADINVTDKDGNTVLIAASTIISEQSIGIIDLLLKSGINVNAQNNTGKTALFQCVSVFPFGAPFSIQAMETLLKYGANPNIEDLTGDNPVKFKYLINLPYGLRNKLEKAAITAPQHIIEEKIINIKYGIVKICRKGMRGAYFIQYNNKQIIDNDKQALTSDRLNIEYFSKFNDDVLLIIESGGNRFVQFRLLLIKKDGSYSLSKGFYDRIIENTTIKDNTDISIIFHYQDDYRKLPKETWAFKNGNLYKIK
jgi:ankyrin repeat protein